MQCAEASWKDMDARRVYEWRICLALWTGLGALAGFELQNATRLSALQCVAISLLVTLLWYMFSFRWIKGLRERQVRNLRTAHYFWDLAEEELGVESGRKKEKPRETSLFEHWSHGSQIIFTLILSAVVLYSTWSKMK